MTSCSSSETASTTSADPYGEPRADSLCSTRLPGSPRAPPRAPCGGSAGRRCRRRRCAAIPHRHCGARRCPRLSRPGTVVRRICEAGAAVTRCASIPARATSASVVVARRAQREAARAGGQPDERPPAARTLARGGGARRRRTSGPQTSTSGGTRRWPDAWRTVPPACSKSQRIVAARSRPTRRRADGRRRPGRRSAPSILDSSGAAASTIAASAASASRRPGRANREPGSSDPCGDIDLVRVRLPEGARLLHVLDAAAVGTQQHVVLHRRAQGGDGRPQRRDRSADDRARVRVPAIRSAPPRRPGFLARRRRTARRSPRARR